MSAVEASEGTDITEVAGGATRRSSRKRRSKKEEEEEDDDDGEAEEVTIAEADVDEDAEDAEEEEEDEEDGEEEEETEAETGDGKKRPRRRSARQTRVPVKARRAPPVPSAAAPGVAVVAAATMKNAVERVNGSNGGGLLKRTRRQTASGERVVAAAVAVDSDVEVIGEKLQSNDDEVPNKRGKLQPRGGGSRNNGGNRQLPINSSSSTASTVQAAKRQILCKICSTAVPTRSKLKRHAVDRHFKEDIAKELSNKRPFRCPLRTCKFEAEAFGPLLRHYGPSHAVEKFMSLVEYTDGVSEGSAPKKVENGTKEGEDPLALNDEDFAKESGDEGGVDAEESENEVGDEGEDGDADNGEEEDEDEEEDSNIEDSEESSEEEVEEGEGEEDGLRREQEDGGESVRTESRNEDAVDEGMEVDEDGDDGDDGDEEAEEVEMDDVIIIKRGPGRPPKRLLDAPKNLKEFKREVHENLRTVDGAHAIAVDDRNVKCVCGKIVRLCNVFYWRYLIQKPVVKNGAVIQKGHWFTCPTVLEKGSAIQPHAVTQEEIDASKAGTSTPAGGSGSGGKRSLSSSRVNSDDDSESESAPFKRRSRRVILRTEAAAEAEAAAVAAAAAAAASADEPAAKKLKAEMEFNMERHIRELMASRVPDEMFLQDGPCFEMGFEVPMCRMCRIVPYDERREMLYKGVDEDSCDISCCFYGFRKLRATKLGQMQVKGYLSPKFDPTGQEMELWMTGGAVEPHVPPEKARYILSLIGDQFCDMVRQEYKCLGLNMSENKNVVWKPAVKGVREMCDVCKTTLFNFHWMCGQCGTFICLDCYQFRRTGMVKDYSDRRWGEEATDEYGWPMCNSGKGHLMEKLLMAQIIPKNALLDLAKKLVSYRLLPVL